jgi:hypothetical protein
MLFLLAFLSLLVTILIIWVSHLQSEINAINNAEGHIHRAIKAIEDKLYWVLWPEPGYPGAKTIFLASRQHVQKLVTEPLYALLKELGYKWEATEPTQEMRSRLVKIGKVKK